MAEPIINYFAVVAAGVASIIIGSLWYGPIFGRQWMMLSGIDPKKVDKTKQKGMAKLYILALIGSLVMAYVLSHFVDYAEAFSVSGALQLGFWAWLGLVAPVMLGSVLWEGKPWKLYLINAGYYLVNLLVMSLIISLWQ